MNSLTPYFKSILEQDDAAIVVCDIAHTILYINPAAAVNYAKYGGKSIVGHSIFDCHNAESIRRIREVVDWFSASNSHNKVHTFYNEKQNKDVYMIALRAEDGTLIGYYEKHEFRTRDLSPLYRMEP